MARQDVELKVLFQIRVNKTLVVIRLSHPPLDDIQSHGLHWTTIHCTLKICLFGCRIIIISFLFLNFLYI